MVKKFSWINFLDKIKIPLLFVLFIWGVEIYEEENTDSDETADETIQVMDLRLKEDAKKGYFGRASGGTDFNNFYEGELLFNKFNLNCYK